ncbi:MAG: tRNA (N6-isopentenyl adenosine(37)-C2)-methylthiotransferase MiaB, partial [Lachnospiraceae bacterium]|nr:tRNA (N6-isopentenyl adenosine(37)-C2)-methylthiotransferase MiaB [Lachnospiraceae bacterium]
MYNEIHLNKIDIAGGPPAEEPARQYYFMAKCQDWVREFEQKKGRRPTAFIQTFGCQMNARDSEKLLGILEEAGFVQGADENSDFVLYNTCTVRENANLKVYGRLGYLGGLKRKNPDMLIALCGCMMQEPQVVEKIRKSYRHVDI